MKISIANKDRFADLGTEISARAAELDRGAGPRFLHPEHSALSLREAQSGDEYLDRFIKLARMRCGIETYSDDVSSRKGWIWSLVGQVRRFLWKLTRHQHDYTFMQQVLVNEMALSGLQFQRESEKKKVEALEARIADLERLLHEGKSGTSKRVGP